MKEVMRQSLIKDIYSTIRILKEDKATASKDLQKLSEHVIGDVALYRNVDAATLAVLIYSIYKTVSCVPNHKQQELLEGLEQIKTNIEKKQFTKYNAAIKRMFELLKDCNSQIKNHIQDVFYAAKIRKGTDLLEQGLSLARAADLMGVSRWDVLQYGGSSVTHVDHKESWPAVKRLKLAREIFAKNDIKEILVDAGPIITLALSQLLWVLKPLKEKTGMTFYITPAVHAELVEKPQTIRRFQFEALHVQKLIREGVLTVYDKRLSKQTVNNLTRLANNSFTIKEGPIEILQAGELETLALSIENGAPMLMDERTLRLLIEKPEGMIGLLESRKRKKVKKNPEKLKAFQQLAGRPSIIRSIELIIVCFEMGLLDDYLPVLDDKQEARKNLLNAVLWNTKYHGASVIEHEIEELMEEVLKR